MATQITAFTSIPSKENDSKLGFSNNVSSFISELPTFKSQVDTIVGEMNSDRTKVVVTNAGLISDDLATVEAAVFSPAITVTATQLSAPSVGDNISFTVQTGKNISVGSIVVVLPVKTVEAVSVYGSSLDNIYIKGRVYSYTADILTITVTESQNKSFLVTDKWMIIPSSPSLSVDLSTVSDSTMTPELGSKTFIVQANKNFPLGASVFVSSSSTASTNSMQGFITAYNRSTGSMTIMSTYTSTIVTESSYWYVYVTSPEKTTRSLGIGQQYSSTTIPNYESGYNSSNKPIMVLIKISIIQSSLGHGAELRVGPIDYFQNMAIVDSISRYNSTFNAAPYGNYMLQGIVPPRWYFTVYSEEGSSNLTVHYLKDTAAFATLGSQGYVTDIDGNYVKDIDDNFITDIDL